MPGVIGYVEHVLAETDHRGLVADGVNAPKRRGHGIPIGDVGVNELRFRVQVGGPLRVPDGRSTSSTRTSCPPRQARRGRESR